MPAYYSVVQYTPDPIIGEYINIGVVVFGEGRFLTHFLQNWSRVKQFGGNVTSLKAFAHEAQQKMDEEKVREAARRWSNCIQFTPPAASLLNPDALLSDAAKHYLIDLPPASRSRRTRRDAIALAGRCLTTALRERVGRTAAKSLLKRHYPISGALDQHEFDISVANGHALFAVQGLSFDAAEENDRLIKDVHATAFSVEDVRKRDPDFPVGVVALLPGDEPPQYQRAVHTLREVGADVVTEDQVDQWAAYMVEQAPL
jgi:hypothetical protein